MLIQYGIAALISAGLIVFVVALNISGRAEDLRRAKLPKDERGRLEAEDAEWSQRYGF